jgi:hypothetical protein
MTNIEYRRKSQRKFFINNQQRVTLLTGKQRDCIHMHTDRQMTRIIGRHKKARRHEIELTVELKDNTLR